MNLKKRILMKCNKCLEKITISNLQNKICQKMLIEDNKTKKKCP